MKNGRNFRSWGRFPQWRVHLRNVTSSLLVLSVSIPFSFFLFSIQLGPSLFGIILSFSPHLPRHLRKIPKALPTSFILLPLFFYYVYTHCVFKSLFCSERRVTRVYTSQVPSFKAQSLSRFRTGLIVHALVFHFQTSLLLPCNYYLNPSAKKEKHWLTAKLQGSLKIDWLYVFS